MPRARREYGLWMGGRGELWPVSHIVERSA
jgi:hypothetical protein